MKFILGKKIGMTQMFDDKNTVVPVTKILIEPNTITQIKTKDKEGVDAVQVSFSTKKHITKPLAGHYKGLGNFRYSRDFRVSDINNYKVGDKLNADMFSEGDIVSVVGTSKGKGFAGVVKRHGFGGHNRGRGTKDQERTSGSIGATGPQRVLKGTRMAGRMGGDRVTIKGLKVIKVDKENNILYVKGAVPGARNSMLMIKEENK
jgi:large subunit ribosomal protein L3